MDKLLRDIEAALTAQEQTDGAMTAGPFGKRGGSKWRVHWWAVAKGVTLGLDPATDEESLFGIGNDEHIVCSMTEPGRHLAEYIVALRNAAPRSNAADRELFELCRGDIVDAAEYVRLTEYWDKYADTDAYLRRKAHDAALAILSILARKLGVEGQYIEQKENKYA